MNVILNAALSGYIKNVTFNDAQAIKDSIGIWEYKGHNPLALVSLLSTEGGGFVAGIRDYVEPTLHVASEAKTKGAALMEFAKLMD